MPQFGARSSLYPTTRVMHVEHSKDLHFHQASGQRCNVVSPHLDIIWIQITETQIQRVQKRNVSGCVMVKGFTYSSLRSLLVERSGKSFNLFIARFLKQQTNKQSLTYFLQFNFKSTGGFLSSAQSGTHYAKIKVGVYTKVKVCNLFLNVVNNQQFSDF